MFRGCKTEDMPPHIYSLAQTAYRTMLESRRDQSLIFMGRSGSGKTTTFKHALYYLALAAGKLLHIVCRCKKIIFNFLLYRCRFQCTYVQHCYYKQNNVYENVYWLF